MAQLDVDHRELIDVILTHMHYDHVGGWASYPKARFHLQEKEMRFVTGRHMHYPIFGRSSEPDEVVGLVRLNFQGRIEFYNGEDEIAPAITINHLGGISRACRSCASIPRVRGVDEAVGVAAR